MATTWTATAASTRPEAGVDPSAAAALGRQRLGDFESETCGFKLAHLCAHRTQVTSQMGGGLSEKGGGYTAEMPEFARSGKSLART